MTQGPSTSATETRDALGQALGFRQAVVTGVWWGKCPRCGEPNASVSLTGLSCPADGCGAWSLERASEAYLLQPWPARPDVPGASEPEPLPVDVLPPVLGDHARGVAVSVQVSPDMTVLLGLCAVSAAAAGKVEVRVDDAWTREWVTLYGVIVAPPGERKSAAYAAMTEPLREWEADEAARVAPEHRMAVEQADVVERRLRRRKDEAAREKATADQVEAEVLAHAEALRKIPVLPALLAQDSTPEALVAQMAEQGGRVAVMSPEGGPLQILDGRYSDGAARLEELAQAYDGEELRPRRIGRETKPVRRPALTLAVALQPSVLATIRNGRSLRGQGIYGRIAWVMPRSLVGSRVDSSEAPALDRHAADRYAAMLRRLLEWAPAAVAEDGTLTPHVITLSPEAVAVKRRYHYAVENAMGEGGALVGVQDHAAKSVGRAVRIAVLLELAARAADGRPLTAPISGWSMEGAARLCASLSTHAQRVYAEIGMDDQTRLLRYVLDRATGLPEGSTLRDLFRAVEGRPGLATMDDFEPVVERLVERGCVRVHTVVRGRPGRPPSPMVEVHPALRTRCKTGDRNDRTEVSTPKRLSSVDSVSLYAEEDSRMSVRGSSPEPTPAEVGTEVVL